MTQADLVATIASGSAPDADALEAFLDDVLSSIAGLRPRLSDGVVVLREEVEPTTCFMVGKVFLIADQTTEPVCVQLALASEGATLRSGAIRFGNAARDAHRRRDRVETMLLAFPHEAVADIEWAHELRYADGVWTLVAVGVSESHRR